MFSYRIRQPVWYRKMIQDIEPKRFHNEYAYRKPPKNDDVILAFSEKLILAKKVEDEHELVWLTVSEYKSYIGINDTVTQDASWQDNLTYLFVIDDRQYFLYRPQDLVRTTEPYYVERSANGATDVSWGERLEIPGYEYRSMYKTRSCKPKEEVLAAATGWHLHLWYSMNRYCGACGTPVLPDEKERMLRCPSCGHLIFPTIAPAVIVGVTDGNRIILTTYAAREYKRYALIAGFTEIGETVEETVRREVMEEVGIPVKNIRYYKSQPWGFDSNLLMGFFCQADRKKSDEHEPELTIDREELASGEWVEREQIPDYGEHLSLTHEMMIQFKRYGQGVFDLKTDRSQD